MSISRDALATIRPPSGAPAKAWADRITACWRASVEAILEVGRLLAAAKEAIPHGGFTQMIESELPFSASTAQRLMAIAADPKITNPAHVQLLPPSWGTLYELTKLSEPEFEARVAAGTIRPDMERGEVINGARAIMGSRVEPDDSLDFFPTPPWATRALIEHVFCKFWFGNKPLKEFSAWEPACGQGHIAGVLKEYFRVVRASDIFDYGCIEPGIVHQPGTDFLEASEQGWDWIITNPPFGDKAVHFVLRALDLAKVGVAMFVRSQWAVEGVERYEKIFRDHPPTVCAFFTERVPLCKGEWNPYGTTATAYCWLVWVKGRDPLPTFWIPPGCRQALTRPDDIARFAPQHLDAEVPPHDPQTGEVAA